MALDQSLIDSLFRELYLFNSLDDYQLAMVARKFEPVLYEPDTVICAEGDPGDFFYIIAKGQVAVSLKVGNIESPLDVLIEGDFFGEESLLYNQPRAATVRAITPSLLLRIGKGEFDVLLDDFPQARTSLIRIIQSHRYARTHQFDWLGEDEVIYQIRRKHEAYLVLTLIPPVLLGLFAFAVFLVGFAGGFSSLITNVSYFVSGLMFLAALGWGAWNWIDWGNDYYIVTDQRVVWIEHVIWLYDSRMEAPLTTVLSVNVKTSFSGRLMGFGDVIVRTFTGQIVLRTVGEPYQMAALIEEYWHRAQRGYKKAEELEMEKSVRRAIGLEEEQEAEESPSLEPSRPVEYKEPSFGQKYFGNVFKMRFEEENTITFRKHWILLLKKAWMPTLGIVFVLVAMLIYDALYLTGRTEIVSPLLCQTMGIVLILLVFIPWWIYNYIDWRNDIYQVTDKNIFDIERKPLGTESRKSASLENVLSLEHERPGFLGYFFNYGNVTINIGDAKFDFVGVHEPARIQQDVFNRMYVMRQQKERAEVARERDRIVALLATYHRNVERADG